MNNEEKITYEEFMIMFKNAPKLAYMLYDKAEDEIDRLNNIIDKLEKILENEWIYYDQIVFNTHAEFDDEEQVNRFWQEYGAKLMLKNIQDKLKELKEGKLNDEVEIIEEEKKIPEKLKIEQNTPNSNYYIRNENGTKCCLTKHSKMIIETLNQVIDYLKSKGDE